MLRLWLCFQGPYALGSYSCTYGYYIPHRRRKFHWAEFWIVACTWHHLSPRKKTRTQVMSAFAVRNVTSSSARQSHIACLSHSLHGRHGSSHVTDSYWYALFAHFLHNLSFVKGLQLSYYVGNPLISTWCGLTLPWYGPIVDWCEPDSSISSTKPKSPFDQIKLSPQTAPIVRTSFGLNSKTGLDSGPTSPNNKCVERGRKS